MATTWVDFKELRKQLRFADVLKHYGVELKVKGDRATGFCPLPGHKGQGKSPSFSAHLGKGIFQCFGCGASGNLLDFAARMEGLNPDDPPSLRKIALALQERFLGNLSAAPAQKSADAHAEESAAVEKQPAENTAGAIPAVVNAPLDFELKNLDPTHPYLRDRGFTRETIDYFGLGLCNRGLLKNRIAIPLHDTTGKLIAYAGRIVDDRAIDEEHPKYLFPPPRERDGKVFEFQKSRFLYRGFDYLAGVSDLIVVEGFASVWWLRQHNQHPAVALMGASCSSEQAELICRITKQDGRVWVMPDGDDGGERCAESVLKQVTAQRFARWIKLAAGKQPTDLNSEDFHNRLVSM